MANTLQIDLTVELALQPLGRTDSLGRARLDLTDQPRARGGSDYYVLATGVSDHVLSLGDLTTASEALIVSSQPISLVINASLTPLVGKVFLFSGAAITALSASNSSGVDAQVQVILAGS
jgi:hypothetical protein